MTVLRVMLGLLLVLNIASASVTAAFRQTIATGRPCGYDRTAVGPGTCTTRTQTGSTVRLRWAFAGTTNPYDGFRLKIDGSSAEFTGKERDGETGLDYFGARYFSGVQGRFTSPDQPFADQRPEDPQSWNLYTYTRNNPLRFVDEDGQASVEYQRRVAVRLAWEQEQALVRRTGRGSRAWSSEELAILRSGGRPKGYCGHHIFNVASRPDLAGDPRNIAFKDFPEHMEAHYGGRTRIPTTGALITRGVAVLDVLQTAVSALADYRAMKITGVGESRSPFSFGQTFIVDPAQAAITLDGAYIQVTGDSAGLYQIQNGMYIRAGCSDKPEKCSVDPKKLKGAQFEIVESVP